MQRHKTKQDRLTAFYRHLNVASNIDLINLDRFNYTKNTKKVTSPLKFYVVINGFPCHKKQASFLQQKR